ncbi:hypothetical protein V3N99_22290 (plasmid) [Dermatophilaceae bacterium Soc4.6]
MQLKTHARAERLSQPEVLLDALAATQDHLGDLIAARTPAPSTDGLFLRRTTPRTSTEPMATVSMRMLGSNVDVIDQLVTTHDAPSRSALCAAALRHYLA